MLFEIIAQETSISDEGLRKAFSFQCSPESEDLKNIIKLVISKSCYCCS